MDNFTRYNAFNTTRNSHLNLNTNMPMPTHPNVLNNYYKTVNPNQNTKNTKNTKNNFVNGSFNRIPPPPTLANNR
jgi:hypothetical protein